jgi:hypothetical protein
LKWFQRTRYSECKEPVKCQLGGKVNWKELGYLEQTRQFWGGKKFLKSPYLKYRFQQVAKM